MNKPDIIARLSELGITETSGTPEIPPLNGSETAPVLKEILAAAEARAAASAPDEKSDVTEPEVEPEAVDPASEVVGAGALVAPEKSAPAVSAKVDSVDILKGKEYVRTYSLEVHGKDFRKLAEEFTTKRAYSTRGYTIVPSDTVIGVVVRYREKEDAEKPLDDQKPDAPIVDKRRNFTDKEQALSFNVLKKGALIAQLA